MLTIYGIKNCDTMKKAFNALSEQGLTYTFHDYKKQGIDAQTLEAWLKEIGADVLLNKKGTTWKKLSPEQQQYALANDAQLIETLIASPSMIKRPVLDTGYGFIVGFNADQYQKLAP